MKKLLLEKVTGRAWMAKIATVLLCGALMAGLTGCGSSDMSLGAVKSESVSMDIGYATKEEATESVLSSDGAAPQVEDTSRKLIKTVEMTVETKEYDVMLEGLNRQIEGFGGYVENMSSYNGSIYSGRRSSRNASMTIRIPEDKLDAFLKEVSSISNVVRRSDKVDDVTLAYVDLSSHKEALQTEQTRLLELLKKAETVEDIITIEERLSSVRYQIESMESQLRTYDNQISYSTVYLEINEVQELTPVAEETVWERISGGFVDSLNSIGDGFVEFVIWLAVNSPFLVIWAVIIIVVILVLRKMSLKRRVKKAAINYQGQSIDQAVSRDRDASEDKEAADKSR